MNCGDDNIRINVSVAEVAERKRIFERVFHLPKHIAVLVEDGHHSIDAVHITWLLVVGKHLLSCLGRVEHDVENGLVGAADLKLKLQY